MKKIILASASPRRKKIVQELGLEFEIIPSDYEEFLETLDFTYEKIEDLAFNKAKAVISACKENECIIVSADTVVVLDNKILGKPEGEKEAFSMLKDLSGKKHAVVTSICALNPKTKEHKLLSTTSLVEFENLSDETIENYVNNFKPLDKAGAYGIQELPEGFVKSVEGSFENIIGLCPVALETILKEFE